MFMLAVDINQQLAELLEHLNCSGMAIDPAAGSPLTVKGAAKQALIITAQLLLFKPLGCAGMAPEGEMYRKVRTFAPMTDHR